MTLGAAKVSVVVLNWNGWKDTLACLQSLLNTSYPALQLVVCDNGSDDDSVERIREWAATSCPLAFSESTPADGLAAIPNASEDPWQAARLVIIQTGGNLGFARGNNVGIRHALASGAEYVFVLNNDTRVQGDCLQRLVEFGRGNPGVALMGPKVLDEGSMRYSQWPWAHRLGLREILLVMTPLRRIFAPTRLFRSLFYAGDRPGPVYAIPGCAMMFKATILEEVGLFDEATFLYWEELIIAEKLLARDYVTYLVPAAVIWHTQGASIRKIGARRFMENVRSERYFFSRYLQLPAPKRAILDAVRLVGYVGRAIQDADYRRHFPQFLRLLLGRERHQASP